MLVAARCRSVRRGEPDPWSKSVIVVLELGGFGMAKSSQL